MQECVWMRSWRWAVNAQTIAKRWQSNHCPPFPSTFSSLIESRKHNAHVHTHTWNKARNLYADFYLGTDTDSCACIGVRRWRRCVLLTRTCGTASGSLFTPPSSSHLWMKTAQYAIGSKLHSDIDMLVVAWTWIIHEPAPPLLPPLPSFFCVVFVPPTGAVKASCRNTSLMGRSLLSVSEKR